MDKKILNLIKLTIGLSILFFLLYKIGFKVTYQLLININLIYIPLILLISSSQFFIGILNLKILLQPLNSSISFLKLFKYYCLSWAIGTLVPGKLGEFSLVYFLKKENIDVGKSTVISIIDKLITVLVLSVFTIGCFLIFFTQFQTLQLVIILFVGAIIFSFFIISDFGRGLIKKYILRNYAKSFKGFSKTFFEYLRYHKSTLLLNLFLTLIKWVIMSLIVYVTFLSFDQRVDFISVLLINMTTVLISLIPVTINGLGIKESAAVFLYSNINIDALPVMSTYLILIFLTYIQSIIFLLLFSNKSINFKSLRKINSY